MIEIDTCDHRVPARASQCSVSYMRIKNSRHPLAKSRAFCSRKKMPWLRRKPTNHMQKPWFNMFLAHSTVVPNTQRFQVATKIYRPTIALARTSTTKRFTFRCFCSETSGTIVNTMYFAFSCIVPLKTFLIRLQQQILRLRKANIKFHVSFKVSSWMMPTGLCLLDTGAGLKQLPNCWSLQNRTIASTMGRCPTYEQPRSNLHARIARYFSVSVLAYCASRPRSALSSTFLLTCHSVPRPSIISSMRSVRLNEKSQISTPIQQLFQFYFRIPSHRTRLPQQSKRPLPTNARPTLESKAYQPQFAWHIKPSSILTLSVFW